MKYYKPAENLHRWSSAADGDKMWLFRVVREAKNLGLAAETFRVGWEVFLDIHASDHDLEVLERHLLEQRAARDGKD